MSQPTSQSTHGGPQSGNPSGGYASRESRPRTPGAGGGYRGSQDRGSQGSHSYGGQRGGHGGPRGAQGDRDPRGGGRGGFRRRFPRRKISRFTIENTAYIDYRKYSVLKEFLTERGKIIPRRITGNSARHQRMLTVAIKRARFMALLSYTSK